MSANDSSVLARFKRLAAPLHPPVRKAGMLIDPPRAAGISDRAWDGWVREDIEQLIARDRPTWLARQRKLYGIGQAHFLPTANRGEFRGVLNDPPIVNQTQTTLGSIAVLWDAADLTALPLSSAPYGLNAGQIFKVTAGGVQTQAITGSQTITWTPVFGTAIPAGNNVSLGASIAAPVEAKVFTNQNWLAEFWVHFRTVTQTGSTGVATCFGRAHMLSQVGVAAGTAEGTTAMMGTGATTAVTVVTNAACGLVQCVTPSLTTQQFTAMMVCMESLN